jgi:GTP-binding protein
MGRFEQLVYETSALSLAACPAEAWPEVAVSGRSNVGKSSLLNKLAAQKALARVSQRPGKTQALNFFRLGESRARLVDLPGYGFAEVPRAVQASWRRFMNEYLEGRGQLAGLVQLVDCRHEPTALDRQMIDWLAAGARPFLIVLTKSDKLPRGQRQQALAGTRAALGLGAAQPIQLFSAEDGTGRAELIAWIDGQLTAWRPAAPAP